MKKNNKGFMLAEVVVTSTILLVIMISLFFTFNKIYARYNSVTAYKNIDGMYALDNFMEYIMNERENDNINKVIAKVTSDYLFIIKKNDCQGIIDSNYCSNIQNGYNIENLVFVRQRETSVNTLINDIDKDENKSIFNNTFREYLNYIQKYYALWKAGDNTYNQNSYLLITEFRTDSSSVVEEDTKLDNVYNYSSLELR